MNILLAVTNMTAANGGVTTHIIDLCRELCRREHKVVLLSDENNCDYQKGIEALKKSPFFLFVHCNMVDILFNPKRLLSAVNFVSSVVQKEKIEIIHVHSQSLCIIGACVKVRTGVPYIWTNHIDEMANPKLFGKVLRLLHFPIISVSSDLKQMLIKEFKVNEKRITVINNGINPENFPPLDDLEKAELRKKFDCEGKYTIGLLARMSYGKGHMYLLEAVNKLQKEKKVSNIKVLIAGKLHEGEKDYLKSLQDFADVHQVDMEFLGFQNPRDVFGICNISTLPSIFEGFGLTVIESLIMACPVIRSDTPGWIDTKDISLVFKKRDVDGFAEHLYYAYTHPLEMKNMGKKGKEIVLSKFTIKNQVDKTIDVYKKYME